jgi:predicted DNA-binding transcriptional regulator AlpA
MLPVLTGTTHRFSYLPEPATLGRRVYMSKEKSKRMLNFKELSVYIGLAPQTIRNKFYAGEFPIPAKKIFSKVLWDIKDVDKYLDNISKIDC